jgi:UDP-N-acetylmuramoyl-L-alanyl-D-glutamate--2,6-diaminopimelate ligase
LKRLNDILAQIRIVRKAGPENPGISSLCFDSRTAGKGSAFFAVHGTRTDGHEFIGAAIKSGSVAVVCERIPGNPRAGISYVQVEDSSLALALAAEAYFGHPSRRLKVIGVTGTNGKTTVATLLHQLFSEAGHPSGLLSTVRNLVGDRESPATHTTPDPLRIHGLMAEMLDAGCRYCFMEVSSHAIHQKRVAGIQFAGGIFTNITHEHLDYHGTFKAYIAAKKAFFDALPAGSFALVNRDDRNSKVMLQNCPAQPSTFGLLGPADFRAKILESHLDGMKLLIDDREVWSRLAGDFNAGNLLAIYGCAVLCGLDTERVLIILSRLVPVRGRFESMRSGTGVTAIVDYAHTPDALRNVLGAAVRFRTGNARLITVVGAGGNRDKTKRPLMGKVAAEFSQKLVLTSDNPRDENPGDIIRQMIEGIPAERRKEVLSIPDRAEAIKTAVMLARKGDIILVAGKGHETYQEIGGKRFPFNDVEVLREYFKTN